MRSARATASRGRELVREPERREPADRFADGLRRAAPASAVGATDRHLLTEDRPHAELERVERPGHAQPTLCADERTQPLVACEMAVDDRGIDVEIEEAPHAGDEVHEPVDGGQVHAQPQRLFASGRPRPRSHRASRRRPTTRR